MQGQINNWFEEGYKIMEKPKEKSFAQELKENNNLEGCLKVFENPTLLFSESTEKLCTDKELVTKEKSLAMTEPNLKLNPEKGKNLQVAQETYYPEVAKLKTLVRSKLQLAESVPRELVQLNRRSEKLGHSVSAQALETLQYKPLYKKLNNKEIELDETICTSKINQGDKIAFQGNSPLNLKVTQYNGFPPRKKLHEVTGEKKGVNLNF